LDRSGNIFLAGAFRGTVDFDPEAGVNNLISSGEQDVFLAKYTSAGAYIWARSIGGSGVVFSNSIAVERSGNIFTGGMFWGGFIDVDPGTAKEEQTPMGEIDLFVHKMGLCTTNNTSSSLNVKSCGSYELNCKVYTSSGVYKQVLSNATGCDSTITINLTIDASPGSSVNASACSVFNWRGKAYKTSGIFKDTVKNSTGCDSVLTLQLIIKPTSSSNISATICPGQNFRGFTKAGRYADTLVAANGCDSIVSIQLTVNPVTAIDLGPDQTLCPGDSIMLRPGLYSNYLWQDGSTSDKQLVTQTGLYTVNVSGPCGIARDDIRITTGICSTYFPSAFTPNQDGRNDVFNMLGGGSLAEYQLMVYDRWGKKIFETRDIKKGWTGNANGKIQPAGVYIWSCRYKKERSSGTVTMKGSITLIR
jgi:gliding motility-associated-like protein